MGIDWGVLGQALHVGMGAWVLAMAGLGFAVGCIISTPSGKDKVKE